MLMLHNQPIKPTPTSLRFVVAAYGRRWAAQGNPAYGDPTNLRMKLGKVKRVSEHTMAR